MNENYSTPPWTCGADRERQRARRPRTRGDCPEVGQGDCDDLADSVVARIRLRARAGGRRGPCSIGNPIVIMYALSLALAARCGQIGPLRKLLDTPSVSLWSRSRAANGRKTTTDTRRSSGSGARGLRRPRGQRRGQDQAASASWRSSRAMFDRQSDCDHVRPLTRPCSAVRADWSAIRTSSTPLP